MKNASQIIQALIPHVLILAAVAFGVTAIASPEMSDAKWAAVFGLSGSAIAAAAGLAQSFHQQSDFSVEKRRDSLKVETPRDDTPRDKHDGGKF